ncbi:MAG: SMR family transporter [Candidatus Nitrotoga sp.]|nr:SMR family transporter [Candidatus Nitrotoga sp.]MDW7604186.1 SMR family transporter [Candidatus Nitrotoga sp.]MDW7612317.1 SMR family transporter [Candidatus Nitrotoga sp.]MDW7625697.1 SMR family transporter [Candidatus Nitrotoga sp.]
MSLANFGLIFIGMMLNVIAQLMIKAGTTSIGYFEFSRSNILPVGMRFAAEPLIIGALVCYALSVIVWILTLSRVQVSIAYPLLSMGYVVNMFAAWWLFNESINPTKIAGVSVIILGVIIIFRA